MNRSVAKRYAHALIELAQKRGKIEKFFNDLSLLIRVFEEEPRLFHVMSNPVIPTVKKSNIIKTIREEMDISEEIGRLVDLLVEKRRFSVFSEIISFYKEKMDETLHRIEAIAVFSFKPSSEIVKIVTKRIEEVSGKKAKIIVEVDPDIIGGIIVKYRDAIYDGSIRMQIKKMLKC
ncbi:MAG: ATP synthase F1 subunit delta [Thermodesulfobacteriota bacterium]|nr:ATP synthase F1 subunit delta [Thermodesulfobacteriota bacterium]